MKRLIVFLLLVCSAGSAIYSQQADLVIRGKVTDLKNLPLSNVSVTVKEKRGGVITDDNGSFQIVHFFLPGNAGDFTYQLFKPGNCSSQYK